MPFLNIVSINYGRFYMLTVVTASISGYFHFDVNYNMQSFVGTRKVIMESEVIGLCLCMMSIM
jgi:hypothetical protein